MFFTRTADGLIAVDLPEAVRQVLELMAADLRALLLAGDDERLRRLFPTAYPHDAALDAEYHQLMDGDLLESKLADLDTMDDTLRRDHVDDAELTAWMTAINGLRLVLGTQLDVSESNEPVPADDPQAMAHAQYDLLTLMVGEMIPVLAATLPPAQQP